MFVNQPLDEIDGMVDTLGLSYVQLHGDEGPSFCSAVAQRTGARVIKAVRIGHAADLRDLDRFHTDLHLLDASVPGQRGGTGQTFDWSLIAQRRSKIPFLLSGGLTPENVGDAIAADAPVGRRHGQRRRGVAGHQGRGEACARSSKPTKVPVMSAIEHRFGPYGGQYVPETLIPALEELEAAWIEARADAGYRAELATLLNDYVGRPSPLYRAARLSEAVGHTVYLKREDLNHTGAHKINNALGQCLLAKRMGKTRIIAETGAGQHGVATATACALLGPRVRRLHGHRGHAPAEAQRATAWACSARPSSPVDAGTRTLKEATSAAIRDWTASVGRHALRDRHVRRPGAVSGARARAAARDRRRGARADAREGRSASRPRDRVRRRRLERDRHLHARSSTTPASHWSASRARATGSRPAATARR